MGKILSRLICCSERFKEQDIVPKVRPDTPTRKVREPLVYRDSIVVRTNSEIEREELQTAIKYFILKHNKE